jgi:FeS assembly SUF system protein
LSIDDFRLKIGSASLTSAHNRRRGNRKSAIENRKSVLGRIGMAQEISGATAGSAATLSVSEVVALQDKIVERIRTCYDPEIPVNIYDLGLIYGVNVEPTGDVLVKMTLTAPGCPAAGSLPGEVEDKVTGVPGVKNVKVEVVWEPPWDKDRMSEAAKLQLGMF